MKIGILGGTFDPIHNAHLFIAEEARVRYALDHVLFIPNSMPPHKQSYTVSAAEHRFNMTELAVGGNPFFFCSAIEIERPGPSYTVDTLAALHAELPDSELYLITGLDTILEIPTWHRPEEVIRRMQFIVAERPGYAWDPGEQDLPEQLVERVLPLATMHLDISSTDIRRRVREGLPARYLTPEVVVEYIAEHGLYVSEESEVNIIKGAANG